MLERLAASSFHLQPLHPLRLNFLVPNGRLSYGFPEISVQLGIKPMSGQEKRQRRPAIGYTRTSSAANVGADKDSVVRQRKAVQAYANRAGYKIVAWFDDPAVAGSDTIDTRPGFMAALEMIAGNGVRTIIVETANRFARDLIVQETGWKRLNAEGVALIAADSPDQFVDDTPTAVLIRQILGAVAQFDKAMTVAKLRGARERKRRRTGAKVEGRKSWAERKPEMVQEAKRLQAANLSLREIAAELARLGHVNENGATFSASSVKSMLA
ncbi:recombinase family protein [Bradyrhizobium sp. UFLA05-112]